MKRSYVNARFIPKHQPCSYKCIVCGHESRYGRRTIKGFLCGSCQNAGANKVRHLAALRAAKATIRRRKA